MGYIQQTLSSLSLDPKVLVAFFSPFLAWALNRWFSPSAKLNHSIRHAFHYLINEPLFDKDGNKLQETQGVQVASISVANSGRSTAKSVEIVFNWKPSYINVWPIRSYTDETHPDGRYSVKLESLASKEVFGLELLAVNRNLPEIVNVRCEQVESAERKMLPQVVFPNWFNRAAVILTLFGFVSFVYFILLALEFVLK